MIDVKEILDDVITQDEAQKGELVKFIWPDSEDPLVGIVTAKWFSEDWEETEYQILSDTKFYSVPQRGLLRELK
jgi:hypothetical protein